mgnify:CR=1 FL=1
MNGKNTIRGSTANSLQTHLARLSDLRCATIAAATIESGGVTANGGEPKTGGRQRKGFLPWL